MLAGWHISWISEALSYYFEVDFKCLCMLNVIPLCLLSPKMEGEKEVSAVLQNRVHLIEFIPAKAET